MIKTGIFGIIMVLFHSQWQAFELYILVAISLITAFNGVLHALTESNLKRALAYSSIETSADRHRALFWQLGILFGNPLMSALGLAGALLHVLFHSLFKSLLFYLSGNIMLATHSLNIDALGGLHKRLKSTSMLFLLAAWPFLLCRCSAVLSLSLAFGCHPAGL
jgi:hydrogenase-4 component B